MNLCLYEDAITFCDTALDLDEKHYKTRLRKAISLAYLFEFKQSREILGESICDKELYEFVQELQV